jgi:hypothetical protein
MVLLAALALALALVGLVAPSRQSILDPATHSSPSGRVTLRVEPEERTGLQGADYRLSAGDEVLWHGRRPFALRLAAVGEDGVVAGVAYASGDSEPPHARSIEIVLLAPDGKVLFQESLPRRWPRISHAEDVPRAFGVFLHPELGRFVVWLEDRQVGEGGLFLNRLRSHDLRSGVLLSEKHLADREYLVDLRPVPGTPLVLSGWMRTHVGSSPPRKDVVFQLFDGEWNVLWAQEIENDYEAKDSTWSLRRDSPILSASEGRFELRSVRTSERISFGVERSGAAWNVSELARTPHDRRAPQATKVVTASALRARLVARIPLEAGEPRWTPWRGSIDSTFGRVLLQDGESLATQVFDGEGRLLALCEPQPEQREAARSGPYVWERMEALSTGPDGRVYVGNRNGHARFSPTGVPEGVVELGALIGFPPWPGRHWNLQSDWLFCFPDLRVAKRPDGNWLRKLVAGALARDGSLALLDVERSNGGLPTTQLVLLYEPTGLPRRAISLPLEPEFPALAYQGRRVLASSWKEALLVDTEDGSIHPLELDPPSNEQRPRFGLSPDGAEVWVLEREARILARYAIGE